MVDIARLVMLPLGLLMMANAGMSMLFYRRSYKSEERLQVPLDVKIEMAIALSIVLMSTLLIFTRDNRNIAMNHQTAHKTNEQVFNRRNMRTVRWTRSHLHTIEASATRVPPCSTVLRNNPKLAKLGTMAS